MRKSKKQLRLDSIAIFSDALDHPDLATIRSAIRAICKRADRFHRTVSAAKAEKIKSDFLRDLRRLISRKDIESIHIKKHFIDELLLETTRTLKNLDEAFSENIKDWKPKDRLAQARIRGRCSSGKRGLQGGAPQ